MPYTRTVCTCHVDKNLPSHPGYLDSFPYFCKEKRNPANLFTFPKCHGKLGGLRVSAQSSRQLFYKKNIRVDFFFLRPLDSPEDRAAPPPRKTWTSLARRGRVGPAFRGASGRQATPRARPAAGCAPGRSGWARGPQPEWNLVKVGLVAEGARRGCHPRMRSGTLAFSLFPLS